MATSMADADMTASPGTSTPISSRAEDRTSPIFSSPDADVVLCSKDNVRFRVYSVVLRTTSGWFRTMFNLPQNQSETKPEVVLHVLEHSEVLTDLLKMVSGLELPEISSLDWAEAILDAAEKYDMPGPISIIRKLIIHPPLISCPLRVYALACRWDWAEEAKIASTKTLCMDLGDEEVLEEVQGTGLMAKEFSRLLALHRSRRDNLRNKLEDASIFSANAIHACGHCGLPNAHHAWQLYKSLRHTELEERPFGETLTVEDLLQRAGTLDVLEARCSNEKCKMPLYQADATIRQMKRIIDELPKSI